MSRKYEKGLESLERMFEDNEGMASRVIQL